MRAMRTQHPLSDAAPLRRRPTPQRQSCGLQSRGRLARICGEVPAFQVLYWLALSQSRMMSRVDCWKRSWRSAQPPDWRGHVNLPPPTSYLLPPFSPRFCHDGTEPAHGRVPPTGMRLRRASGQWL